MEGGSANDYDYCSGDPVNCNDLDGLKKKYVIPGWVKEMCGSGASYAASKTDTCSNYRLSVVTGRGELFFHPERLNNFKGDVLSRFKCPAWVKTPAQTLGVGGFARAAVGKEPISNTLETYGIGESANALGTRYSTVAKVSPWVTVGATAVDAACTAKDRYTR